ncbi:MAG: hypothetical protein IJ410_07935 [Oscillospiraceae bacterium]|nr:hypothetical protein [Oscillospiraceae bacterium]
MAKNPIRYYDELREFNRMEDCAEKTQLAVSRLENPYNLSDEDWVMYQDYLSKKAPKTVPEFIDTNRITMFPLLVKYKVIRKANINKMVDYAHDARKMDILSYLLNAGNDLRSHPKNLDIAPKFTPGKSVNNAVQKLPQADAKPGDIVWMGKLPLPWQVLENKDGRLLVISKYAFDCQAYNNTFYKMRWEDSAVCKWLNTEFLPAYFTSREQAVIRHMYIDEDTLYTEKTDSLPESRLFFLSVAEVNKYFRTEEDRKARVTLFGKRKILWQHFDVYAHWWLRTPSLDDVAGASHVQADGGIALHGGVIMSNGYDRFYDHYGVRPAMYLDIK